MELKPFGINVTEVWAGTMKTDINAKVAADLDRYAYCPNLRRTMCRIDCSS